jgi:hypothetical protein
VDKAYVEVFLPAFYKSFDFFVPLSMKAGTAALLMAQTAFEQEQAEFVADSLILAIKDTGRILDDAATLQEAGVRDGQTLILV